MMGSLKEVSLDLKFEWCHREVELERKHGKVNYNLSQYLIV